MVRGRKPVATAIHEASGAYEKNPQRKREHEPILPLGAPEMPPMVKENAKASEHWLWCCGQLAEMRVLTKADMALLTVHCLDWSQLCWLWEQVKEGNVSYKDADGNVKPLPAATVIARTVERIMKQLPEFGLTASARSRLVAPKKPDDANPLEAWRSKRITG